MSYKALYALRQNEPPKINRNKIRDEVQRLTGIPSIRCVKTTLDTEVCRGSYISARNTSHQFVKQTGQTVIILARSLNYCWERFVYTKELMHAFDDPNEQSDTGQKFDIQISELIPSGAPSIASPHAMSEVHCFWMALGILCAEKNRLQYAEERAAGKIDDYAIALALRIPQQYVPRLFEDRYSQIIKTFLV